jgi:hypothetical protein
MSADTFIQAPGNLQSYNRYAYVMNNPLAYTDPSGYISFKKLFRAVVAIAVAAVIGDWTGQTVMWALAPTSANAAAIGAIAGGAAGGAAAGFTGAALGGANLNQSLQAGVQGALTGALFGAAGGVGEATSPARYAAHAGAGCVSSVAGGGNCGQGAASAVFGKFTTNQIGGVGGDSPSAMIARGVATAVAGSVGSVIAGGKFENGATTAAFGYLFNQMSMKSIFKAGFHGGSNASDAQIAEEYKSAASGYAQGTVKEAGRTALKFATSDVVDIGGMVLGNSVPGKIVSLGGLAADGIDFYVNSKSAGLWGFGVGTALQTVSPVFKAMPEWASSRAAAGVSFGIEKGVENTYDKK